jgi:subtilisin family serine protease
MLNWKAMRILGGMVGILLLLVPAARAQGDADGPFQAQASRELMDEVKNRFIFVFNDSVPRGSVPEWADALVREHGGQVIHNYTVALKGFAARMAPEAAARLAAKPFIAYYEQDQIVWAVAPPAGKGKPPKAPAECTGETVDWGVTRVGGPGVGTGMTAWVIDTGVELDHRDLNVDKDRAKSFVGGSANDGNGHGTHVAGIIGAIHNNGCDTAGVAAGATIVPVRVLGNSGSGFLSDVIAGVNYVATDGVGVPGDVANMSLGGGPSSTLDTAVVNASKKGIYFTLAAGNETDSANNHSPARANGANIFTISAIDRYDNFAWFSNYGNPPIDYAAPGVSIRSLYKGGGTAVLSGTSMAAPHVAGILLITEGSIDSCGVVQGDPDGQPDTIASIFFCE